MQTTVTVLLGHIHLQTSSLYLFFLNISPGVSAPRDQNLPFYRYLLLRLVTEKAATQPVIYTATCNGAND